MSAWVPMHEVLADRQRQPTCQWPVGSGRPWRLCCEPTILGRPYCRAHCLVAYNPVPHELRDDATDAA